LARLDSTLKQLQTSIIACTKYPRLAAWRKKTAREKIRRFIDYDYWGKSLPGFGDILAEVLIAGLAPAAIYWELGLLQTKNSPKFGHTVVFPVNDRITLLGSFHPGRQNTFANRLTEPIFDAAFEKAKSLLS
jgi:uracil-DNA glycosylase